jgi:hypothetical protein
MHTIYQIVIRLRSHKEQVLFLRRLMARCVKATDSIKFITLLVLGIGYSIGFFNFITTIPGLMKAPPIPEYY